MGPAEAPVTPELPRTDLLSALVPVAEWWRQGRGRGGGCLAPDFRSALPRKTSPSNGEDGWGERGRENNYFSASNLSSK